MEKQTIEKILNRLEQEKKIPLIEVHQLTPIAPSLLNRDFNNRAKTSVVGGKTRAYLSSASQKRPIRVSEYKNGATRSKLFPVLVAERLKKEPYNKDEEYCLNAAHYIAKSVDEIETGQIFAFDGVDVERVAKDFADNVSDPSILVKEDKKGKKVKKVKKTKETEGEIENVENENDQESSTELKKLNNALIKSANGAKIDDTTALMGRMSTDARFFRTIVSALHMNHAYSVDEWRGDLNFFVAVDDYKRSSDAQDIINAPEYINFLLNDNKSVVDTAGAAMVGDNSLSSNTFYRYASISMRTLIENKLSNLDDNASKEEIAAIIKESADIATRFIKDYVFMVPMAKQTENATTPSPLAVLVTAGTRVYPQTADANFERVIRATDSESVGEQAVRRLSGFADSAISGAFAVNEYQKMFWVSELYKDMAPEACKTDSIANVLNEISSLITDNIINIVNEVLSKTSNLITG